MGWFSKIFSGIDKVANDVFNPLEGVMKTVTDDTIGKIPGIGKPLAQLGDFGITHPAEAAATFFGGEALGGALGLGGAAADAGGLAADAGAYAGEAGLTSADLTAGAGAGLAADGTAMGGAAGILGGADSALASGDLGLTAADVGGAVGSGIGDIGGFSPGALSGVGDSSGIGLSAGETAGNAISTGDLGATTSSGFGGVGVDPGVAASPDGGLALSQGGAAVPGAADSTMQQALKIAAKYGPLGISLAKGVMGQSAYSKAASQLNGLGAQQKQTASGLVSAFNNGTLNPAESAGIDTWAQNQVNALKQFYANAGQSDSTQAQQAIAQVQQQAVNMKNQASQNLLQVGLSTLNGLDANTVAGINLNLKGDLAAQQAQADFASTFAKLIGAQQSGVAATPAPATAPGP